MGARKGGVHAGEKSQLVPDAQYPLRLSSTAQYKCKFTLQT
jgi:hypothetical protein